MWENPLDNMEVFEGSPVDKWKEVIFILSFIYKIATPNNYFSIVLVDSLR